MNSGQLIVRRLASTPKDIAFRSQFGRILRLRHWSTNLPKNIAVTLKGTVLRCYSACPLLKQNSLAKFFRVPVRSVCSNGSFNSEEVNETFSLEKKRTEQETEDRIIELIETHARPHAQSDGGDIQFLRLDHGTGVVHVTMKGACVSCSSSTITLKFMVLKLLQNYVDGITDVEGHDEIDGDELI